MQYLMTFYNVPKSLMKDLQYIWDFLISISNNQAVISQKEIGINI